MFNQEGILDQRAAELLRPSSALAQQNESTHVLVSTGSQRFALPLNVLRAASKQKITPVPLSPPEWVGVTHYMEEFWPVRWLGRPQEWTNQGGFVLFLRGRSLGLLVEHHLGLITVPAAAPPQSQPEPVCNGLEFLTVVSTLADATSVLEMSPA